VITLAGLAQLWRCACASGVTQRIEPDRAAWLFAFDIAEIAILLFLTGGLQNPFSFLLLGPVLLSATALPPAHDRDPRALCGAVRDCARLLLLSAAVGSG